MLGKFKEWFMRLPTWASALVVLGLACLAVVLLCVWLLAAICSYFVFFGTLFVGAYLFIYSAIKDFSRDRRKSWDK